MIPFTKTTVVGSEIGYLSEAINPSNGLAENGKFFRGCVKISKNPAE